MSLDIQDFPAVPSSTLEGSCPSVLGCSQRAQGHYDEHSRAIPAVPDCSGLYLLSDAVLQDGCREGHVEPFCFMGGHSPLQIETQSAYSSNMCDG